MRNNKNWTANWNCWKMHYQKIQYAGTVNENHRKPRKMTWEYKIQKWKKYSKKNKKLNIIVKFILNNNITLYFEY